MIITNEPSLLITRKQAGLLLSLSERSIDFLLADGRLTRIQFGSRMLVSRAQVESLAVTGIEGRIRPC
jgi:hypothetical protein